MWICFSLFELGVVVSIRWKWERDVWSFFDWGKVLWIGVYLWCGFWKVVCVVIIIVWLCVIIILLLCNKVRRVYSNFCYLVRVFLVVCEIWYNFCLIFLFIVLLDIYNIGMVMFRIIVISEVEEVVGFCNMYLCNYVCWYCVVMGGDIVEGMWSVGFEDCSWCIVEMMGFLF